ncbi:hypothetical protein [Orrella dioscoreae]|uniref:Phage protein n=1 Tax=Orrella dioscoreae TaxID=1851544 RepID=A0A1C3K7Q4_9BURK|nr:hypothetical protein [Orrella dioscoreae]SBT27536.1 Phage protein [Orrella dioscoreae]SOE48116.1 Phage protein [Orrella dioscoreae]
MNIHLTPQLSDRQVTVERDGDALTIDGRRFDFSGVTEGATLPESAIDCDVILGPVERIDGVLHVTLLLPHGAEASQAARFPAPINNPPNGPVEFPK